MKMKPFSKTLFVSPVCFIGWNCFVLFAHNLFTLHPCCRLYVGCGSDRLLVLPYVDNYRLGEENGLVEESLRLATHLKILNPISTPSNHRGQFESCRCQHFAQKIHSIVWCHYDYFTAWEWVGASPIPNRKYQTCMRRDTRNSQRERASLTNQVLRALMAET